MSNYIDNDSTNDVLGEVEHKEEFKKYHHIIDYPTYQEHTIQSIILLMLRLLYLYKLVLMLLPLTQISQRQMLIC